MPFSDAGDHVGKNADPHCGPQFSKKIRRPEPFRTAYFFWKNRSKTTLRPSHAAAFPALLCDQAQENDGPS